MKETRLNRPLGDIINELQKLGFYVENENSKHILPPVKKKIVNELNRISRLIDNHRWKR